MRCRTSRYRVLVCGPGHRVSGRCCEGFTGIDKTTLSIDDVQMATDVYDDCIAYLDRRLGLLLDELSRRGVLENTLVIVTSDHGEHLGDHRLFFHGVQFVPAARAGAASDRGKEGNTGGSDGRGAGELMRSAGHGDRPARSGSGSPVYGPIGCTVLATAKIRRAFVWWPIRCSWRQRSPNCS